jgi:signal transduction histidine kinase
VILDRLTVREKVNLLALIPLLVSVLLLVPLVATRLDQARQAAQAAGSAETARQVGALAEQMQQLRLLSVAYLSDRTVAPNTLAVALQDVLEQRSRLADQIDPAALPALADALNQVKLISDVEAAVTGRWLRGQAAVAAYGALIDPLVDALELGKAATATDRSQALAALDALLRSDEATSEEAALLLIAALSPDARAHALAAAHDEEIGASAMADQFDRIADPAAAAMFALVTSSQATARRDDAVVTLTALGTGATPAYLPPELFAAAASQTQLRRLVEARVAQDIVTGSEQSLRDARITTAALGIVGAALLLGVVLLSLRVGRSVSGPLRRLTGAAARVAHLAQEELLRVADEDNPEVVTPRLAAIDVRSSDEIGELAEAFNRVQATAALLLERQVVSRRNVASMFASVGRRSSNLIGRQLALIDALERAEDDPDTLSTLYRLDHTATRLRRSASSLIVLSGSTESIGEAQPMPVGDVVRSALGTVEEFQRFTLRRLPKLWVAPGVVGDLSLLLAELLENAALFSPPRSQVEVIGSMARDGSCSLSIIDHGMGMPPERMAEENARMQRRERLDLAPSDVLGLFVVGRIARRHDIEVHLEQTPPNGVTAVVKLPAGVLVDGRAAGMAPARSISRRREAAAAAGATRRELAGRVDAGQLVRPGGRPVVPTVEPVEPAGTVPAVATSPAATSPAATSPAAAPPGAAGANQAGLTRRIRGANWKNGPVEALDPERHPSDQGLDVAAQAVPVPPPPPGGAGVARRVPGTHLSEIEHRTFPDGDTPTSTPPVEGLDPVAARRQVEDVDRALARAKEVAEHGAPLPPPPTPAELGTRAGMSRRVPGAALGSVPGGVPLPERPAEAAETGAIDAEELRRALDDVDKAIVKAQDVRGSERDPKVTEQRLVEQAEQAAVRAAAGRRAEQHEAVENLAEQLRTGEIPRLGADADPAPADSGTGSASGSRSGSPTPMLRRIPGATLDALGAFAPTVRRSRSGATSNGATSSGAISNGASGRGGRPVGPTSGPIALRPERPEDVLTWANDLQEALARVPDRPGHERSALHGEGEAGNPPDSTQDTSENQAGASRPGSEGDDG